MFVEEKGARLLVIKSFQVSLRLFVDLVELLKLVAHQLLNLHLVLVEHATPIQDKHVVNTRSQHYALLLTLGAKAVLASSRRTNGRASCC